MGSLKLKAKGIYYTVRGWWTLHRNRIRGLKRFEKAQEGVWERAMQELLAGEKRTHWMWFIFPQSKGLGTSARSKLYALSDREAKRYIWNPTLGSRLDMAAAVVFSWLEKGRTLEQIFGEVDAMKFQSSMDLFHRVTDCDFYLGHDPEWARRLVEKYEATGGLPYRLYGNDLTRKLDKRQYPPAIIPTRSQY